MRLSPAAFSAAEMMAAGSIMRAPVRSGTGRPAALKAASITVAGSAANATAMSDVMVLQRAMRPPGPRHEQVQDRDAGSAGT